MTTAESAARYLLHLAAIDREPSPITQMHLHKLLYFAQGWSLAVEGHPLFDEEIQAWKHGPVVPAIRPAFKRFGQEVISKDEASASGVASRQEQLLLESIWRQYRRYSASGLRAMSHRQSPWREARKELGADDAGRNRISPESIAACFNELYNRACRRRGIDPEQLRQARADVRAGKTIPWDEAVAYWRTLDSQT